jgi:hypothetical protein
MEAGICCGVLFGKKQDLTTDEHGFSKMVRGNIGQFLLQ